MAPKARVILVDDSALVRGLLAEIIDRQTDMCCIGAAAHPLVALEMIPQPEPDVITLDVEMPRMDGMCRIRVAEAVDDERVLPGHACIAPGGRHLSVERAGTNYRARVVGRNALAVMLTGMGTDGAKAMRAMRDDAGLTPSTAAAADRRDGAVVRGTGG